MLRFGDGSLSKVQQSNLLPRRNRKSAASRNMPRSPEHGSPRSWLKLIGQPEFLLPNRLRHTVGFIRPESHSYGARTKDYFLAPLYDPDLKSNAVRALDVCTSNVGGQDEGMAGPLSRAERSVPLVVIVHGSPLLPFVGNSRCERR